MKSDRQRTATTAEPGIVAQNVEAAAGLEAAALARRTASERLADAIARMAGTPGFAVFHVLWFAAWVLVNVGRVPGVGAFDPFPFSFLTLVVSLEAIFLSIFVLVSQNVLTRQADRRAQLDLQINLLAEQESTRTMALLQRIATHLGVPSGSGPDERELATPTDLRTVATTLDRILASESVPDSTLDAGEADGKAPDGRTMDVRRRARPTGRVAPS